jgi:hypothetical protein
VTRYMGDPPREPKVPAVFISRLAVIVGAALMMFAGVVGLLLNGVPR